MYLHYSLQTRENTSNDSPLLALLLLCNPRVTSAASSCSYTKSETPTKSLDSYLSKLINQTKVLIKTFIYV